MRKVLLTLACLATVGLAQARADVDYKYIATATSFTGNVGDTINVSFFIRETLSGSSTSLIFSGNGLFGGSFLVDTVNHAPIPTGGSQIIGQGTNIPEDEDPYDFKILANTKVSPTANAATYPGGFGGTNSPTNTDNFTFASPNRSGLIVNAESLGSGAAVTTGSQRNVGPKFQNAGTPGSRDILLGTLNFIVGTTDTTFVVKNYFVQEGSTIYSNQTTTQTGLGLDNGTQAVNGFNGANRAATGFDFFTFTIGQAIPEPSSMALCGLIGCGFSYAGYRRRKAAASAPVIA